MHCNLFWQFFKHICKDKIYVFLSTVSHAFILCVSSVFDSCLIILSEPSISLAVAAASEPVATDSPEILPRAEVDSPWDVPLAAIAGGDCLTCNDIL